jgi:hypothetical protein
MATPGFSRANGMRLELLLDDDGKERKESEGIGIALNQICAFRAILRLCAKSFSATLVHAKAQSKY